MNISFERSGGFAGMILSTSVDTTTLAPTEAHNVEQLVEAADFFNLPATLVSPQPDRFQYQITIAQPTKQHTVTVGEASMPGTLRPLIDWLTTAARQAH